MKMLDAGALDAFEDDELVIGAAARLMLPSATYRAWSGYGDLTLNGEVFTGIGASALLTPIASEKGGGAEGLEIKLSRLEPSVAASIELEDYHQKPITIWRLIFNPSGTALLGAAVFMRGRIDTVPIIETIGGSSALVFKIEGPRRDMSRRGTRMRSDTDQRLLGGPTDGALRHVSVSGRKTLYWGAKPSNLADSNQGAIIKIISALF